MFRQHIMFRRMCVNSNKKENNARASFSIYNQLSNSNIKMVYFWCKLVYFHLNFNNKMASYRRFISPEVSLSGTG